MAVIYERAKKPGRASVEVKAGKTGNGEQGTGNGEQGTGNRGKSKGKAKKGGAE